MPSEFSICMKYFHARYVDYFLGLLVSLVFVLCCEENVYFVFHFVVTQSSFKVLMCLIDLHVQEACVVVFMSRTYVVGFDVLVNNEINLSFCSSTLVLTCQCTLNFLITSNMYVEFIQHAEKSDIY